VQAYIEAMPGWKREVGRALDALIVRTVPDVQKAVRWNSPFYGVGDESQGWFLSFHCFAKSIKVAFFRGASLHPVPPGASTSILPSAGRDGIRKRISPPHTYPAEARPK